MRWFIAKIVFRISCGSENEQREFEEQLRLIAAANPEEALLKARIIGLQEEDSFINNNNKRIKWEFINVPELLKLDSLNDGTELYSRIKDVDDADSYTRNIHYKAMSLRLHTIPNN